MQREFDWAAVLVPGIAFTALWVFVLWPISRPIALLAITLPVACIGSIAVTFGMLFAIGGLWSIGEWIYDWIFYGR